MKRLVRILMCCVLLTTPALSSEENLSTRKLLAASRLNRLTAVQQSLSEGADVNAADEQGKTPLVYAVAAGNPEMVALLLESGAAVDILDSSAMSPAAMAAWKGRVDILKQLVARGGDLHRRYRMENGQAGTLLHIAVLNKDMELARYLLSEQVSTEIRNSDAESPLMLAAAMDSLPMVKLLVEHGANLYADRGFGGTLLDSEMFQPSPQIKRYLQEVERQRLSAFPTPGWAACLREDTHDTTIDLPALQSYLQQGGSPEGRDAHGRTLLHYVAACKNSGLLESLLAVPDADVNAADRYGQTPLHLACRKDEAAHVKVLLDHDAAVDARDADWYTPLTLLAKYYHSGVVGDKEEVEIARMLLEKGADVNAVNAFGETPLLCLAEANMDKHLGFARLLIEHGADVNRQNYEGNTFLHRAAEMGTAAMMKLVIEAGADLNLRNYAGRSIADSARYDAKEKYDLIFQYKTDVSVLEAAYYSQPEILDRLAGEGADLNMTTDYDNGATALIIAAKRNNPEVVKKLIALNANVNSQDQLGSSALHYAAELGHDDIVWQLLQNGADVNLRNKEGRLAAQLAKANNKHRVLQLFKDYYQAGPEEPAASPKLAEMATAAMADPNRVEPRLSKAEKLRRAEAYLLKTSRPLHTAVIRGQLNQINQLLTLGADVHETDEMGMLPLNYAVLLDNLPAVMLLLQKGADLNRLDANGMFWEMLGIWGWGHTIGTEAGWGTLHYAVAAGSQTALELLIKKGADVNQAEKEYQKTPIFMALQVERPAMLKTLLDAGANLKHMDKQGETLFHSMARQDKIDYLKLLMELGVEVDTPDRSGNTALMTAANMGQDDVMIFLLENGADVSGLKKIFASALAKSYTAETLRILIEYGVDVNTTTSSGKPPLFELFKYGSDWKDVRKNVQLLLDSGVDVHACNKDGDTVLHYAAKGGDMVPIEFAELMLEQGVDADRLNNKGETALQVLLGFGGLTERSQRLALMLAQKSTDVNRVDRYGCNTLHLAAAQGLPDVVTLLASKGADLNNRENDLQGGKTPLHSAVWGKKREVIQVLLEAGADISAADKMQETPLFTAIHRDYLEGVQLLLDYKADCNVQNQYEETPLHVAVSEGRKEIVAALLKAGARTDIPNRNRQTAPELARKINKPEIAALFQ